MAIYDLLNKKKYISALEQDRRKAVCATCPKLAMAGLQCGVCKCLINLKVKLITENCPLGKWPVIG